jgi:hypothetical protein
MFIMNMCNFDLSFTRVYFPASYFKAISLGAFPYATATYVHWPPKPFNILRKGDRLAAVTALATLAQTLKNLPFKSAATGLEIESETTDELD